MLPNAANQNPAIPVPLSPPFLPSLFLGPLLPPGRQVGSSSTQNSTTRHADNISSSPLPAFRQPTFNER